MTSDSATDTSALREAAETDLTRSEFARIALAAWVNVPVDQLGPEKVWIEHPNDLNRQAWDRVINALRGPLLAERDALAERVEERTKERDSCIEIAKSYMSEAIQQLERAREAEAKVQALTEERDEALAEIQKLKGAAS